MKSRIPLVSLLFSLMPLGAWAGAGVTGHVTMVYFTTNGTFLRFSLDATAVNPDGCAQSGSYFVEIAPGSTASNHFVAALLEAHATGKTIQSWIQGCTVNQYWGGTWPLATDIYVLQN